MHLSIKTYKKTTTNVFLEILKENYRSLTAKFQNSSFSWKSSSFKIGTSVLEATPWKAIPGGFL